MVFLSKVVSQSLKTSDCIIGDPLTSQCRCNLDTVAPPSELLEMCEQSLEEMGAVFDDSNVYMLHMMYQAMGVCLYMQDPDGAIRYGEKIVKCYRCCLSKTGIRLHTSPDCKISNYITAL